MTPNRLRAATAFDPHLTPPALAAWLSVFRSCFTAPVWNRVLVLVAGAVLAPGKRTVTQALRVMGLGEAPQFRRYHEVLGRARWDARAVARRLLLHLLERLLPNGPVVIGIDDTIERRWGARIKARGIYRDPVRSSKGHFVKTSGLRWLSLMVVVPISWSGRHWALPFLTVLAPSARWSEKHRKRHKTLTDWARQAILQTKRWLPDRWLIFVADSGFAALELLASVRCHVCVITRLRLDAALFKPAPRRRKGQRGRPPLKGRRLPTLRAVLASRKTVWTAVVVSQWYNAQQRKLLTATGTAVWYHAGIPPVPIRWVLVRDPTGEHEPAAFLSTDLDATPAMILGWFVSRWRGRRAGTIGRPRAIGKRQPTLAERLANRRTRWRRFQVTGWYGRGERLVEIVSGTAIWHHPGRLVPIRYVLVRNVAGELKPQAFLCTDLDADPLDILRWFVRRWSIEVTFAEVRRHLGVETQRQWSDPAIARTTPALLGLFSLIALWAHDLYETQTPPPRTASWYRNPSRHSATRWLRFDANYGPDVVLKRRVKYTI